MRAEMRCAAATGCRRRVVPTPTGADQSNTVSGPSPPCAVNMRGSQSSFFCKNKKKQVCASSMYTGGSRTRKPRKKKTACESFFFFVEMGGLLEWWGVLASEGGNLAEHVAIRSLIPSLFPFVCFGRPKLPKETPAIRKGNTKEFRAARGIAKEKQQKDSRGEQRGTGLLSEISCTAGHID